MAKYYINQYIKNIAKKNTNTTEKELDDVEKELDKIANKLLEEGINPFEDNPYINVMVKDRYDHISENVPFTIIKEDQNPVCAIVYEGETPNTFNTILINEEHLNYFNNKFIKYSAKDFIINYLILYIYNDGTIMNTIDSANTYRSIEQVISGIENKLALNDFKFSGAFVLNDIDISDFIYNIGEGVNLVFNENETKKIFNPVKGDNNEITFNIEGINNYISRIVTDKINGNKYKILINSQAEL